MSVEQIALHELPPDLDRDRLPRHVAVIMDGNGRWAMPFLRKIGVARWMR